MRTGAQELLNLPALMYIFRLQFIMRPTALKCEAGRLAASSRESNHKSLAGLDQCAVILRTVDASMHVCYEIA
jgi:hypothetical protein